MFSGIIESTVQVLEASQSGSILQIKVNRPPEFSDLQIGDSVAVNGVCLTAEAFDESMIQFALAAETLQVTQWTANQLKSAELNVERSLKFGARIHGHLVAGHVDAMGTVISSEDNDGSWILKVEYPTLLASMIWKKGSITLNGVSLTVNELTENQLAVCLIPETMKRTNLGQLKPGASVTIEVDTMAKAVHRYLETRGSIEV